MRPGTLALMAILLVTFVSASCGKKASPFLPVRVPATAVTGLAGAWDGLDVLLTGRVGDPANIRGRETFRVYYAAYPPAQLPCEGCPIEFQGYQAFGLDALAGDTVSFRMPGIERGQIYFFEARIAGPEGSLGPPSNRARVDVLEKTLE